MLFDLQKKIRKSITVDHKTVLQKDEIQAEEALLNAEIIDGTKKSRFIGTISNIDSTVDTIEVEFGTGFSQSVLQTLAESLNGKEFTFHKTSYTRPIDYNELHPYQMENKIPIIKLESSVSYYTPGMDRQLDVMSEESMPSIYQRTRNLKRENFRSTLAGNSMTLPASKKLIFSKNMKMSTFNKDKSVFPCMVEMHISKGETDILRTVLEDNNLFDHFIGSVDGMLSSEIRLKNTRGGITNSYKYSFLNDLVANLVSAEAFDAVVVGGEERGVKINFLNKLKLIGDLQKNSIYHSNFKNVVYEGLAANETVFYKIDKYAGQGAVRLINTFFVPSNGDVTSFMDTQVAYGRDYTYVVHAYIAVYGVKYKYTLLSTDSATGKVTYEVTSTPEPMIVESKIYSQSTNVAPNPPLPPSVRFINQSNNENSIKIAYQLKEDSEEGFFVPILDRDKGLSLKIHPVSLKTTFKYNIEPIKVELFRLAKKPKSVLDFKSGFVSLIDDAIRANPTLAMVKEYILPNRKYYYMFRTRSASGLVSNPSPVYEIELVKDSDSTNIVAQIIELDKENGTKSFRDFRRLFQVRPSLNQEALQTIENARDIDKRPPGRRGATTVSNILDRYSLGSSEHSLWGRKFKLRVKSNDSGKVIDFNLNFELTKDKKIEDL